MKWIINADIDNTLIYSYKHDIGQDKICVEIYQGREISFMTGKSYELLRKLRQENGICFVPTTTRTVEQYNRIQFDTSVPPAYALVCNGGVLLKDGIADAKWYQQSLSLVEKNREQMKTVIRLLEEDENRSFEVRWIQELFVFTKSNMPEQSVQRLKDALDTDQIDILQNGQKVYAVPKVLNKGAAAERLKEYLGAEKICSAGDSEFDIPMIQASDMAFFPENLEIESDEGCYAISEEAGLFSDQWLEKIFHCI